MNKQTIIFTVIIAIIIGYLVTTTVVNNDNVVVTTTTIDSTAILDSIKKNTIIYNKSIGNIPRYQKYFTGKWMRDDGVQVEFIGYPTNKFQVINTTYKDKNLFFGIGEYKIINIICDDTLHNIFSAQNLYRGVTSGYSACGIRILSDESFMVFYPDDAGNIYNKIK